MRYVAACRLAMLLLFPFHAMAGACFYEHANYQGASFCSDTDKGWVGDGWNDRVSSVRLSGDTVVTLYDNINYGGASYEVNADVANLASFNDRASSLTVRGVSKQADVWVTYPDRSRLIAWDGKRGFDHDGSVNGSTIAMDGAALYQEIDGFGAAMTGSSAWLMRNRLNATQREALLQALFGFNEGNAGISYVRVPLGDSDFSLTQYTFDDSCCDLGGFSINWARDLLSPLLSRARQINSSLRFMGTPWSAPAWMKTSGALGTGKLRQDMYPLYATYLRRTWDDFNAAGIRFDTMTIQNEPQFEPGSYPGMKYEWYDELNFVRDHLSAAMNGTGAKLLTFDHNWSMEWYPKAVLNEGSAYYAGSAWHCYDGSVDAMGRVHDAYPAKDIYLTECTGYTAYSDFGANLKWNMQNMFIGGVRNWARTVLLWNLALDPNGNPHTGGCNDCRGVVTIDQSTGAVRYNEEFYAIAHFARFVWPGARRIGSGNSSDGRFISAAFRNTNGKKAVVVLNQGSDTATFRLVEDGRSVAVTLPASGVATVFW